MIRHGMMSMCILVGHLLSVNALWPQPRSVHRGTQALRLSERFEIKFSDAFNHFDLPIELRQAMARSQDYIESDRLQLLQVDRGDTYAEAVHSGPLLESLDLKIISPFKNDYSIINQVNLPYEDQDESYTLYIPSASGLTTSSCASLSAQTGLGILRGLTTFEQLVFSLPNDEKSRFITDAPIMIEDEPAFAHRGFMLDTSRNFFSVEDIYRTLDAMSSVKLNVFHWHATDSQSWPLSLPSFPELSSKGAYSPSHTYSHADILLIQQYANARGISAMLEIDMPGHTGSIGNSHPEHIACFEMEDDWQKVAVEPPTGQLKLGVPETEEFACEIIRDASRLSKSSYFSTGGDEINLECYNSDPRTSSALRHASLNTLLSHFVSKLHSALLTLRKIPIVWEEMILNHNLNLDKRTIVMVWISSLNVKKVIEKGFRVIHAASDYLYLDCGAGGWVGGSRKGSWCDPFKSWQKIYSFDPYANVDSSDHHLILGGETLLWTEQTDGSNLDSIAWPRTAAAAEVFWTHNASRSAVEALPRLHEWRFRAVKRGIKAIPLQPEYCALRPGVCVV